MNTTSHRPPSDEIRIEASTPLPTRYGLLELKVFRYASEPDKEHVAIVAGDVAGADDVAVRLHSECMTSEVFGSLKCECGWQLDAALDAVAAEGGIVISHRLHTDSQAGDCLIQVAEPIIG